MRPSLIAVFLLYLIQAIVAQAVPNCKGSSFGYSFPVHCTAKCPMTAEEWENSSRRLGCNKTHGYHCVPDKNISSLIEFCYPRGERIMFQKGNCLELADTGILNHVKCGHFSFGCPDEDYPSNEFYKYPACLSITANCFTADVECLNKQCLKKRCNRVPETENRCTDCSCEDYIVSLGVFVVISVILAVLNIYQYRRWKCTNTGTKSIEEECPELETLFEEGTPTESSRTKEQVEEDIIAACSEKEITVDYAIQDAELFQLLKSQCQNGVLSGFNYLVDTRVKSKSKEDIFCQRDENGCTLLHYAAQGGSTSILDEILKIPSTDVNIKCYRGQTVLHYAIRHKQKRMIEHLITNKKELIGEYTRSSGEGSEISSRKEYFEPLHWVAWNGDIRTLGMLRNAKIDTQRLTRNGLSILDISCLKKETLFCLHILDNEKQITLDKKDECGWNIAHYAARSNNVEVLEHLSGKKENLITVITKDKKTTLHIACEYGQFEAVKHLTETCKSLLFRKDEREWNALHYAVKGGNLQILTFLVGKGMAIDSIAKDGKTLLHVACIHKHVDICKYVADIFSKGKKDLINKTTVPGWLPAHYVGVERKENGSEERIMDTLMDSGMDLSKTTGEGYSIFAVAVDHLNKNLVKHLVSKKYIDALGIPRMLDELERARESTEDSDMKSILQNAHMKWKN